MTGDMPRPSTRLSSREPTRKRRRGPPPLSVTNVFADARLPDNSEALWKWPVTSWYFGDVGNADLHITSDRPFVKNASSLPPLEKHYRLRWLEEDATKFVIGEEPHAPEPLPVIPYARQKDATACARPSKGLGTGVERNAPGRPRKRQCIPKEAPVVEPATIDFTDNGDSVESPCPAFLRKAQSSHGGPAAPASTAVKVEPMAIVAKPAPLSVNFKPPNVLQRESKVPPASNFCTPPLSIPSSSLPSPSDTIVCETPLENTSTPSPSAQSIPLHEDNENAKQSITIDEKDNQDDDDSREEVVLQFVSPVEPRLMGTLTYSFPINAPSAPKKEEKEVIVSDVPPAVNHNAFKEEAVCVEDMDLEFRKPTRPFEDSFDDVDTADELRPEILRLNTLLNDLGPKTKPLRNMIHAVVQSELQRQDERDEAESEEKRIISRLKEIEKEKAAAKAIEKAAKAKAKSAVRRAPGRVGTQGRRRRPSRKIQDEPDSDEETIRADDNNGDLEIRSEPVVVVDKPSPLLENKVVDNRKLLVKAEVEDVETVIANSPSTSTAVAKTPKVEDAIESVCDDFPATRTSGEINCATNSELINSEPKKRNAMSPETEANVKLNIERDDSDDFVMADVENKARSRSESVSGASAAPDSTVVAPGHVKQLGLNQAGSEAPLADLSPLALGDPLVEVLHSSASNEKEREVLVELTNEGSKSLPQRMGKPHSTEILDTMRDEPDLNRTREGTGTGDKCDGPDNQLTPLEPEVEMTTTPITEIDMDASPESDDESRPKETREDGEVEEEVESLKEKRTSDSGKASQIDSDMPQSPEAKEDSPCAIFLKDGKVTEQLDRIPSPVSPIQAATPTCGFIVVPSKGPPKVLTSGSALVSHMKALREEATKRKSLPKDS